MKYFKTKAQRELTVTLTVFAIILITIGWIANPWVAGWLVVFAAASFTFICIMKLVMIWVNKGEG